MTLLKEQYIAGKTVKAVVSSAFHNDILEINMESS